MAKSKKISKKELTEVKELQQQINALLMNIGNAACSKQVMDNFNITFPSIVKVYPAFPICASP